MSSKIPNACFRKPNGKLVSPEEFLRLAGNDYKSKQIFPYCPECDEKLVISNASNVGNKTFYRHYPNNAMDENGIESCSLREKKSNRQGWYCSSFDFQQSDRIKQAFLTKENLIKAYAFCWTLCGKGNLKFDTFSQMLKLAYAKKIWAYSGIKLWHIPYILLTLKNFKHRSSFEFHFVLHKQGDSNKEISTLFNGTSEIQKVFTDSGKLMGQSPNNPLPISLETYLRILNTEDCQYIQRDEISENLYRYVSVDLDKHHFHL